MGDWFDGTDDALVDESIGPLPTTGYPFTMACFATVRDNTVGHTLMSFQDKDVTNHYFQLNAAGNQTGDPCEILVASGGAFNSARGGAYVVNRWHLFAAICTNATSRTWYIDGTNGTGTTSRAPTGCDRISIGRAMVSTPTTPAAATIAWAAIWNVALTVQELNLIRDGCPPWLIRPANLVRFYDEDGWPGSGSVAGLRHNSTPFGGMMRPSSAPLYFPHAVAPAQAQALAPWRPIAERVQGAVTGDKTIAAVVALALGRSDILPTPKIDVPLSAALAAARSDAPVPAVSVTAVATALAAGLAPTPTIDVPLVAATAAGRADPPTPVVRVEPSAALALARGETPSPTVSIVAGAVAVARGETPSPTITVFPSAALAVAVAPTPTVIRTGDKVIIAVPATAAARSDSPTPTIDVTVTPAVAIARSDSPTPLLTVPLVAALALSVAPAPVPEILVPIVPAAAQGRGNAPTPVILVPLTPALAAARADAPSVGAARTVLAPPALAAALGLAPTPRIVVVATPAVATATAPVIVLAGKVGIISVFGVTIAVSATTGTLATVEPDGTIAVTGTAGTVELTDTTGTIDVSGTGGTIDS